MSNTTPGRDSLTYRYPRTLNEAFGPCAKTLEAQKSQHLQPIADRAIFVIAVVAAVFVAHLLSVERSETQSITQATSTTPTTATP